jgi:hypothetical protein
MTASSWAGVIGAIGSMLTAAGVLVTAVRLIMPLLSQAREIHVQAREIHTIVNQQRTDMLTYQRELIEALAAHGISVPKDRSLPAE